MQNIDWGNLPFGYYPTDYNVRCYYRNGEWGEIETSSSPLINIHMASTCLHYGQEAFEGMKAYRGKDNRIRLFRWEENARRMQRSADGILMAKVPEERFHEMVTRAVKLNENYVPPYGHGAALYIRPLLIGTGVEIGVKPAKEYLFMVFVGPVGPYFKEGFNPVTMQIVRDYDRAAPQGTGHIKVGGNYAGSLRASERAKAEGYASVLFLEAKEKKFIDEAGPANFFGVKDNTYITPKSDSILPSITNMSLMQIAKDMGMKVEQREVPVEELETFEEAGACGTAAIIAPIGKIVERDTGKTYTFSKDGKAGPVCKKLFKQLQDIQYGEIKDPYGWVSFVE
ncbi:MAG: branched-chain amino acid aminotransferase [Bacteroidales bacterium]